MAKLCRLYLITPPRIDTDFPDTLARALDAGDVACLQLRLEDASEDMVRAAIDSLRAVTQSRGVAFLLNNNPGLAVDAGCDGVHIEQDNSPCDQARAAFGPDGIVGVSCHDSRHLAIEAAESGADYVSFGPFHGIPTNEDKELADPDILALWDEATTVPSVAMGGITIENCPPLVRAGADFIAVSSAVWDDPRGAAAAVEDFNMAISQS